jgi:opacity protein-like surface antigen
MQLRSFVALALASAALTAAPAAAQLRDAGPYSTRGLTLGLQLNGNTVRATGDPADRPLSAGAGATLGYGLSEHVTLFGRVGYQYENAYADLGARYSFGGAGAALRPYMEGAFTPTTARHEGMRSTGFGATAMIGAEYFLSSNLALDAGVGYTRGRFTHNEFDGVDLNTERNYGSPRFSVGLRWHP